MPISDDANARARNRGAHTPNTGERLPKATFDGVNGDFQVRGGGELGEIQVLTQIDLPRVLQ